MERKYAVIGWAFGIFFALIALSEIAKSILASLLAAGAAALLIPPIREYIFEKTKITIPGTARAIAVIVLLVFSVIISSEGEKAIAAKQEDDRTVAVPEEVASTSSDPRKVAVVEPNDELASHVQNVKPSQSSDEQETPKTVGYKVAAIDEGGYLMHDDVKVVRIEYLLRDISKKTGTDEGAIADQAAKTMQLLRERYGVEVKIVTLLEEMKQIVDETTETDTPTILTFIAMNHAKTGSPRRAQ